VQVRNRVKTFAVKKTVDVGLKVLPLVSDEQLISLIRPRTRAIRHPGGRAFLENAVLVLKQALLESCRNCRQRMATNLFVNVIVVGADKRDRILDQEGLYPPAVVVISPTMRCNLRCYGCYAGEHSKEDDLDIDVFNRVIEEAKELGAYFITISGGEPFVYEGLLETFKRQPDAFFHMYTNGTMIDNDMSKNLAELGNVIPLVSVEGFEEMTDARRGKGTFAKILRAMDSLRKHGVPFGFSATVTRENNELVVSDEFVDFYKEKGCIVGWYFQYMPVGRKPNLSLMPTAAQRKYRYDRMLKLRAEKKMILADFFNDAPLVGGCIAGGRSYLHINCKGDVEPCVFAHFAVDNIYEKSLLDVLKSDFFKAIRSRQPYSDNHLRPCMIIDNPHVLRELVSEENPEPTHPGAEQVLARLAPELDNYASCFKAVADKVWERDYGEVKLAQSQARS